jgi:hypothetical protein
VANAQTLARNVGRRQAVAVQPSYAAGLAGGLLGGLAMSFIMMAQTSFLLGMDAWAATKMAWSLIAGADVIRPGFEAGPILGGLFVHFGLSAVYGLVFAWLAAHTAMDEPTLGALFGFAVYVVNIVLLPVLLPHWVGHVAPPSAAMHLLSALEHMVFGAVLGSVYRARTRDEAVPARHE